MRQMRYASNGAKIDGHPNTPRTPAIRGAPLYIVDISLANAAHATGCAHRSTRCASRVSGFVHEPPHRPRRACLATPNEGSPYQLGPRNQDDWTGDLRCGAPAGFAIENAVARRVPDGRRLADCDFR